MELHWNGEHVGDCHCERVHCDEKAACENCHILSTLHCPLSSVKNYSYRPAHLLSNHLDEVTLTEHWNSMRPQTQTQSLAILRLDIADRAVLRVAGDVWREKELIGTI